MSSRHLVLSDLHENFDALNRFIAAAEKTPGGFDDIWLLGDTFGHSGESTGIDELTQSVIERLRGPLERVTEAVAGNWEFWLEHPEGDNRDRDKHAEQLDPRRELMNKKQNRDFFKRLSGDASRVCGDFTLFHGCSYACYGNSSYRPAACECYLFPRSLNIVTRGLFGSAEHLTTRHFLFGHTHIPGWFAYSEESMVNMWQFFTPDLAGREYRYGEGRRRFGINPGSAGIAGRKTPRTALLLDTAERTFMYLTDEER